MKAVRLTLALAAAAALGACGGGGGGGLVAGGGGTPGVPVVIGSGGSGGSGDTGAIGTIGGDDGGGGSTGGGGTGGGSGTGGGGGGTGGSGNAFGNWGSASHSGAVVINVTGLNPAILSNPTEDPGFELDLLPPDSDGNTGGVVLSNPTVGLASVALQYSGSSGTVAYFQTKTASNWTLASIENPASHGWQYQTFGEWATVDLAGDGSLIASSFKGQGFSTGDVTPVGSMPHTGTATYTGAAAGYLVTGGNLANAVATRADVSAVANFGTGSMTFTTNGTKAGGVTRSDLNFGGNLTITGNGFSGTVSHSGTLTGKAQGKFYGPAAQEIGGAYNLSGSAGQLIGAFGAKQ